MSPARINVAACIDSSGSLPIELPVLSDAAGRELLNASPKMTESDDPVALPIIMRPTEPSCVCSVVLLLPRMRGPVIRISMGVPDWL
ncbi:protein kinase [Psittacid alphaherpesvirus 1]|uniref:Uncharacterized protein US2 n=1 Tax=Psittacid herpesvirus 1 (isolate Amazon parrot/-/97-0001/1997) TaxID=670426 RepID=US02_PSHV1|nr:virion protein US2 [Psittacid alphaherpesvirus 1]Q6UDG1.1 RecName: Full=Uncharacterized protein US2 [Psittacid herpesvirus 1 Amazon parrot/1997]AAQ73749.1 protein kinase [Psittacid alphaherpesvirus 1]